MDVRKLIKFGNSSHVISLPGTWLKKNNLNKGDIIYFEVNGNDELILTPQRKEKKDELKEIKIDVTNKSLHSIKREIVSAYVNNYGLIKIFGKNIDEFSTELREFFHNLLAVEVIEETQNGLIVRDFLNIETISITNIVRRIDIIIRAMISDSKEIINKEIIYDSLMNRDKDINRLTILGFRSCRHYMENKDPKEEHSIVDYLKFWTIFENLEKVGDEIKRFTRYLKNSKLTNKKTDELLELYGQLEKIYIETMNSFYKGDKNQLLNQAASRDILMKKLDQFLDKNYQLSCVPHMIEKLKNLLNHTHSIIKVTTYN